MAATSRTGRLLRRVVRISCARPSLTLLVAVALAVLSVAYAFQTLTFATSTRALLPAGKPYIERYTEYEREFGELDDLAIVVEAPSLPEATVYANRLTHELKSQQVPLKRLAFRIDPKQFEDRALLYLSKERLTEIRDRVFDYQEFLETFAARPTLDQLVDGVATQIANAFVGGFLDLGLGTDPKGALDLRFVSDLVRQISARLDRVAPYRSPFSSLFAVGAADADSAGYFLSDDQRLLFILAEPESKGGSFTGDQAAIEGVRAVIASLKSEFPSVNVGVTGKPALSNDEMTAAFRDSEMGALAAFAFTLLLLVIAFLRVGKPVLLLFVLSLSLCWAIGAATLVVGHLSLFSVVFISIVIGIGIDYGVYFLFRYEEELFLGRNLGEALQITAARSGPGILLSAVTAAATFYVLMLTDFRGLQELGFIAGTAILLSWISMVTVFPAAIVLIDRRHATRPAGAVPRAIRLERIHVPFVDRLTRYPKTVLATAAVVTAASLWSLGSVEFDYNLLNLQAEGTESVEWEMKILATSGRSGLAALSSASSVEELRRKQAAFRALPSVSEVDSALLLIPDDQEEKQKIIAAFAPIVAPVRISRPIRVDVDRLIAALETLRRRFDIAAGEAPAGDMQRDLRALRDDIAGLIIKLRQTGRRISVPALELLQRQVYGDFRTSFHRLQGNLSPRRVGMDDVPEEIRRKFISDSGLLLLQIHPAVNIWDRDGAEKFVNELRSVDPEVTGTPIITYEAIRLMERAYMQGTVYAVLLVSTITFLMLRHVRDTALALLPLALGMVWTAGLMYVFGVKFNLGNVFALPLILGAAAEYGLNLVMRFREGRDSSGPLIARSTIMAVFVSGLTTIVGFGTLLIAAHRGIYSLGLLLTLGTTASLVASLVVLPVLLRMAGEHGDGATPTPVPVLPDLRGQALTS
ncbi:MAG TPA: MMPL family transporter [Candidatus Limnocylindria bacterium]|nr:MMPL family transporter [Candidatus Limnocylindria bacterium]